MKEKVFIPFGGVDVHVDNMDLASVLVVPVYYEIAPSYGSGSREGPFHLLNASIELETIDEETFFDWSQVGIHTLPAIVPMPKPETAMDEIRDVARRYMDTEKFVLFLGGDHAITIGLVGAAMDLYPDVGVLQIDAHLDLRDSYNGSRFNHACVMRRLADDMNIPFVQVASRSFSTEEAAYIKANNLNPFFAHEIDPNDHSWMDRAIDRLPETVYLSLDLDGLDPSVIPGTGTPEPGGLSYRQITELIRRLGAVRRVVAADITELAKVPGTQVSEFTAAKIATKMFTHFVPTQ